MDSIEELYSRVYALTRNSLSDKREYARRHRKRGVNAQSPAARGGQGQGQGRGREPRCGKDRSEAAITPPPTIAAHAGNSDAPRRPRPPAADIYFVEIHRHGPNNPMASVRTSKWTTSIIPPGLARFKGCKHARAHEADRSRIFAMQTQSVSARTNTLSCGVTLQQ